MVAVFYFGGQYAHLIARRVRELGAKSELVSPDISKKDLKKLSPQVLILSGGPASAYDKNAPKLDKQIYTLGIPILGICYGNQLMAYQLDGKVSSHSRKQFGKEFLKIEKSPLFEGLKNPQIVWFSHGDQVEKLPDGFEIIGSTKSAKIAAMQNLKKNFYGIQFHAEVSHTPDGQKILSNFLFKIAKAKKDWNLKKVRENLVKSLQQSIGTQKVLMALSGGVDSTVAATLLKEAIGSNLHLVFIDSGLLRKYDIADLRNVVKTVGFKNLKIVNAQGIFLNSLKGVIDPEEKRKIIAKLYFSLLEEHAKKIGNIQFLGQGTIYPDRIESAQTSKHADKIKSHHNVTLPKGLKLKIVEPLSDFYKDEERLNILREADEIFISELKSSGIYNKVGQSLAALLPIKSVGVMGDSRTYSYIIALRSVDTTDFMTADWSKIPHEILEKISSRIINEVRGVNRVLYDITQKPPATIEYE